MLNSHNSVDDLLRTRRATWYIHVHRYDPVDPLKNAVGVKDTTAAGARADAQNPARFSHLLIYLAQHRPHLLGDRSHDHEEVRLSRRKAQTFGSEAREIIMRAHRRHEFNSATRRRERQWPDGIFPGHSHYFVKARGEEPGSFVSFRFFNQFYIRISRFC